MINVVTVAVTVCMLLTAGKLMRVTASCGMATTPIHITSITRILKISIANLSSLRRRMIYSREWEDRGVGTISICG